MMRFTQPLSVEQLEDRQLLTAVLTDSAFKANTVPRNDDGSTAQISLPFTMNFFGQSYNKLYVNNNGNVTFNGPQVTYTPFALNTTSVPIIAVSAYAPELVDPSAAVLFFDYLLKPVRYEVLKGAVHRAVTVRRRVS